jgi:hypothetical protein
VAGAAAAAAGGWQELCDDPGAAGAAAPDAADGDDGEWGPGSGDAAAAAAAAAASQPGGSAAAAAAAAAAAEGLQLDSEGNMAFYLLDAFENPDRTDTLYLFGKAWDGGKWASCCAVVPNMHRRWGRRAVQGAGLGGLGLTLGRGAPRCFLFFL